MSRTKINVAAVVDSQSSINSAQSTVSSTVWWISATKGGVDPAILARNNIGWRLNLVQQEVSGIAQQIQAINNVVSSGAMLYD